VAAFPIPGGGKKIDFYVFLKKQIHKSIFRKREQTGKEETLLRNN